MSRAGATRITNNKNRGLYLFSMKQSFYLILLLSLCSASNFARAQNPVNWKEDQLMQPQQLAQTLQSGKDLPVLVSIGPAALIPRSVNIGMVQEKENLDKLEKQLKNLPKERSIVIYCGCCPYEHCPNVRPAMALLNKMKFTNYHLLDLPHNLKKDWIDKGYPVVKAGK
jgi:thiosulfate/3-mercaptopyruvate sulfurtransferase